MTTLAVIVWRESNPSVRPALVNLVEDFDPIPVSVVSATSDELGLLVDQGLAWSATSASNDEIAMVRSVARCIRGSAHLGLRATNGYPGRLPPELTGQTPAYPVLDDSSEITTDPDILRIHSMAIPTALNLSQAPPSALDSVDVAGSGALATALRVASVEMPVVVAAGRAREGVGALSSIARLPWTIAIGAAEPNGTSLSPGSPRGIRGGDGPFVCANKFSYHEEPMAGTSFAAPRVSRELLVLAGFFRSVAQLLADNGVDGVSLGTLAIVDEGRPDPERFARLPIPSYPLGAGLDENSLSPIAGASSSLASRLLDHRTWVKALAHSARPMQAYGAHEVGHGFVSECTTLEYLAGLRVRDLFGLAGLVGTDDAPWFDLLVADSRLERAAEVWAQAAVIVYSDYRSDYVEVF